MCLGSEEFEGVVQWFGVIKLHSCGVQMSMASVGACILIIVFISLFALNAVAVFLTVECTPDVVGQYGQPSLLKCIVKPTVQDTTIRVVIWRTTGGKSVLVYHESLPQNKSYQFAQESWTVKNMDVSLRIANTKVEDDGRYKCTVMTDSGEGSGEVNLKVVAKYRTPVISSNPKQITQNSGGTLMCDTVGGYPQGSIHWFDEFNTDWTTSARMEAEQTEDGLFQLSSTLPLKGGSTFSKYICVVRNASGGKEAESAIDIKPTPAGVGGDDTKQRTTHIIAAVVVIGSLIVGLLLAIYCHKRRNQNPRRPSAAPLMDDHPVYIEGHPQIMEDKVIFHQV
ncbi:hypothetical protein INR49_029395 [Caranx melampygus]|nr:hypothetical protein INR49_029395 [Caranx melampygus]